jgi:uncharacterized metal-binding protein YceD (DUF177 family)
VSTSGVWTDRVRLDQIGKGVERHLVADEAARADLKQALDLAELSRLEADLDLRPAGAGWRLKGRIQADLIQTCGVTLDPLPSMVESSFSVDLVAADPARSDDEAFDLDPDGPDGPDIVDGGGIDLAAYVAEHLALAVDPWPRKPGAMFEAPSGPAEPSPFDVLKTLKSDK